MESTTQDTISSPGSPIRKTQRRAVPFGDLFKPHEPIPRKYYLATVALGLLILLGTWSIVTYGGMVHPAYFLPSPTQVVVAGSQMIQSGELPQDAMASTTVVIIGWILAALAAIPFGILMGSYKIFEALFEPIVDFVRYLPASAMIPLLLLYIGIDVREKIAVIFIGTFFQLILLVADTAAHVSKDLLDSAYTLGASRRRVLTSVLIPATLPGVMDSLRITLGWAWTYVIVAELVASDFGLGIMIQESERGLHTERIFVGLVTIGLLGFICDFAFKVLHRRLIPWSPRIR